MTAGDWVNDIHVGDARDLPLPDSSVHCVMTSPPYFGQRDYGVDGQIGLEESLGEFVDELVEVYERHRPNVVIAPDSKYACHSCRAGFEEYVEREVKPGGREPGVGMNISLGDMEPEDVGLTPAGERK